MKSIFNFKKKITEKVPAQFFSEVVDVGRDNKLILFLYLLSLVISCAAQLSWHGYQENLRSQANKKEPASPVDWGSILIFGLSWAVPKIFSQFRGLILCGYFSDTVNHYVSSNAKKILLHGEAFYAQEELRLASTEILNSLRGSTYNILDNGMVTVLPDMLDLILGTRLVCLSFPNLAPVVAVWYMAYLLPDLCFSSRMKTNNVELTQMQKKYSGAFSTILDSLPAVLVNNAEKEQLEMFLKYSSELKGQERKKILTEILISTLKNIITTLGFCYITYDSLMNSPKTFGWVMGMMNYLTWPLARLSSTLPMLSKSFNEVRALENQLQFLFEKKEGGHDLLSPIKHPGFKRTKSSRKFSFDLVFENVCFTTPAGIPIIENFNDTFRWGEKILLTGKNGAGKSTLLKLILCLQPLTSGRIFIRLPGGEEIQCDLANKQAIRKYFSVVEQSPKPINLQRDKNIALGKADKVTFVSRVSQHSFYREIPSQRASLTQFSGGEAQKMSILRALANPRTVALFDEPTSALDMDSQEIFHKEIKKRKGTICLITHNIGEKKLAVDAGFREVVMPSHRYKHTHKYTHKHKHEAGSDFLAP